MGDLTNVLLTVTMGLSAWTLLTVHQISVRLAVQNEQLEEHKRRIHELERRSVP